jgi:hypothetical protein
MQLFSNRELSDRMTRIKDVLSDGNGAWEKRVDAVRFNSAFAEYFM